MISASAFICLRSAAGRASLYRQLACLLLISFTIPDAEAAYYVTRSNYVLGLAATDAECGAQNPAADCDPASSQSTATSVSGSVSSGSYSGSSSADLSTGELKIQSSGPTYQATATASLMDQLTFTNISPGTFQTITVILSIDGNYRDGSSIGVDAGFSSGNYFSSDYDYLSMNLGFEGNGAASSLSAPVSSTVFNLSDACPYCDVITSGNWLSLGPTQFIGEVDVFGNNPNLVITMGLNGTGYFDLSNTTSVTLVLPAGIGFTSSSGVFLTAVPVPGAVWLFVSGLAGFAGLARYGKMAV